MDKDIKKKQVVLMYHGIIADTADLNLVRHGVPQVYDVDFDSFKEQVEWLVNSGKECVITFDDGEENNFTNAFPFLKRLGLKAYFFIVPAFTGQAGVMNAAQIKEMADAGMIIGAHGLNHRDLTVLSDAELSQELGESKAAIEQMIGRGVDALSIPYGRYDKRVLNAARAAGYREIFVSDCLEDDGCIGRIAVKRGWALQRFQAAVNGRFAWVSWMRGLKRRFFDFRMKRFFCRTREN